MFEAPATPAGASLQPGLLPGPISGASPRAPLPGSLAVVIPARNAAATIGAIRSVSRVPPSVTMPTLASRPSTPRTGAASPRAPACSSPSVTA